MISLTFTLTNKEVVSIARNWMLHDRSSWRRVSVDIAFAALVAVAGMKVFGSVVPVVAVVLLMLLAYLAGVFAYGPVRIARDWPDQQFERTLTVTDEGIHEQVANVSTNHGWSHWSAIKTLPELYLLVTVEPVLELPQLWFAIPKRAFGSPEEEAAFLDLAHRDLDGMANPALRT